MGLFRDLRRMSAVAKEVQRDADPAAQMREARTQLRQLTAQSELTASPTAINSPATVVAVRDSGTMVNHQPMLECDVTVRPAGGIPFAGTVALLGASHLARVQVGADVTVRHEPGDSDRVVLA